VSGLDYEEHIALDASYHQQREDEESESKMDEFSFPHSKAITHWERNLDEIERINLEEDSD